MFMSHFIRKKKYQRDGSPSVGKKLQQIRILHFRESVRRLKTKVHKKWKLETRKVGLFTISHSGKKKNMNHYRAANVDQTQGNFPHLPTPASVVAMDDYTTGATGARK